MEITDMLDLLAELTKQKDIIERPFRANILDLENRMKSVTSALDSDIENVKRQIEEVVLERGDTVKSSKMMAVYYKGKVSWDTKKLEGLALAHPEIEKCKSIGKAYVQYREVKNGSNEK